MKERFVKMAIPFNGQNIVHYIKEIKNHWWSKWKIVMDGAAPLIFYKLPEGVKAVNELPSFHGVSATEKLRLGVAHIPPPPVPFPKGDQEARASMIDMVRDADEIFVGIKQDGKYYVAYDSSAETLEYLQQLEFVAKFD